MLKILNNFRLGSFRDLKIWNFSLNYLYRDQKGFAEFIIFFNFQDLPKIGNSA